MAGKNITGQLSLFDLIGAIDPEPMEILDLNEEPDEKPIDQPIEQPKKKKTTVKKVEAEAPLDNRTTSGNGAVMSKYFINAGGSRAFVEYWDYNTVKLQNPDEECQVFHFDTSKEAVDFYMDHLYAFMDDRHLKEL